MALAFRRLTAVAGIGVLAWTASAAGAAANPGPRTVVISDFLMQVGDDDTSVINYKSFTPNLPSKTVSIGNPATWTFTGCNDEVRGEMILTADELSDGRVRMTLDTKLFEAGAGSCGGDDLDGQDLRSFPIVVGDHRHVWGGETNSEFMSVDTVDVSMDVAVTYVPITY